MAANPLPLNPDFLTTLEKKPFENIVGKEENAGNQHFLLFPHCFLTFPKQISIFSHIYFCVCKCFQFGQIQNFVGWWRVKHKSYVWY